MKSKISIGLVLLHFLLSNGRGITSNQKYECKKGNDYTVLCNPDLLGCCCKQNCNIDKGFYSLKRRMCSWKKLVVSNPILDILGEKVGILVVSLNC